MNKIKIFLLSTFYFLLSTPFSFAAGLVPCEGANCTWCDLFVLADNIIDFMMMIIFPLAAIMIVWGGITIMISGGLIPGSDKNPGGFKKGKSIITAAVIGILIALLSWLILDTVFKIIAVGWNDLNLGPWNELVCSA